MSDPEEAIRYGEADGIARLTLHRPERLNAFAEGMFREIRGALDRVEAAAAAGRVRVLVVTGAGRGFCAGADLAALDPAALGAADIGEALERDYNPLILRLRDLPVPVLCAVNGVAAGAGASLALAGDLTIATRSARFVLAFARIGLVPDAGATFFLPQRIGKARALGLALLGESIDAGDRRALGPDLGMRRRRRLRDAGRSLRAAARGRADPGADRDAGAVQRRRAPHARRPARGRTGAADGRSDVSPTSGRVSPAFREKRSALFGG